MKFKAYDINDISQYHAITFDKGWMVLNFPQLNKIIRMEHLQCVSLYELKDNKFRFEISFRDSDTVDFWIEKDEGKMVFEYIYNAL